MNKNEMITKIIMIIIMITILVIESGNGVKTNKVDLKEEKKDIKANILVEKENKELDIKAQILLEEKVEPVLIYDNLTMEELTAKLNRVMTSSLAGKGEIFASYALQMGVDPYIALAIVLQETGCYWGYCSAMVQQCNNIGGMKGGASRCWNGSYAAYSSIDEGIVNFINTLAYGYFYQGLTTPELMNHKYAEDQTWAAKVNNYVNIIRNS